jgi:hypothetical protein
MVSQLSTSDQVSQQQHVRYFVLRLEHFLLIPILFLSIYCPSPALGQNPGFDLIIEPPSAVDLQFMADQRTRVEQLANRLGRGLTGNPERDVETLQRIIDDNLVSRDDTLTLQAMGVVFGDLLGDTLDMHWVVYRDNKGRSRALRYRTMDIFLFPVTMISRRQEASSDRRLKPLFNETVTETRAILPGGKWFQ